MFRKIYSAVLGHSGTDGRVTSMEDQRVKQSASPSSLRDVERLRAVLETAGQISLLQDVGPLAMSTAKTLNERFNYYHVRVYLAADSGFGDAVFTIAAEVADESARDDIGSALTASDSMVNEAAELKNVVVRDRAGAQMSMADLQTSVDLAQVAVPVAAFGDILGAIYIQCGMDSHVTPEDTETVSVIARQLGVGINNIRLREEAEEKATNDERRRLARELHDSVAGDLAALLWQMEDLVSRLASGEEISVGRLKEIRDVTKETLSESRRAVWNLQSDSVGPRSLSELLKSELTSLENISGISTQFEGNFSGAGLRPQVEIALLRIGQETINNVRRHSEANHVCVSLTRDANSVTLGIADDGRGFTAEVSGNSELAGFGFASMRERALSVGADLTIDSTPGRGTRIEVKVENALD